MKMSRILLLMSVLLCAVPLSAQVFVFIPVGTTSLVTRVDLVFVVKGIWAIPDLVKGQAAYNACALLNPNNTIPCAGDRSTAITSDIQDRFYQMMIELRSGVGLTGIGERDTLIKTKYKFVIEQGLLPQP